MKILPLLLSICLFIFVACGFFQTTGKQEKVYGICSVVGLFCIIFQIAIVF